MWLALKHLPAKDAQINNLIATKDEQILSMLHKKDEQFLATLTAKDQQIRDMLTVKNEQLRATLSVHNEQIKTILEAHKDQTERMHQENQRQLAQIIAHCKDEMTANSQLWQHDLNQLGEAIESLNTNLIDFMRQFRGVKRQGRKTPEDPPTEAR